MYFGDKSMNSYLEPDDCPTHHSTGPARKAAQAGEFHVRRQQMPTVEELLALDLLTLREHTELAGDRVDPEQHAANLRESLRFSRTCVVRRNDLLVAYAMLNQVSGSSWFVRGFNTHPEHRSAPVLRELLEQVSELARRESITELRSHVYKTNRLSMAFHRRIGFRVTKENAKGVEFFATVEDLASNPSIERTSYRQLRRRQAAAHIERWASGHHVHSGEDEQ